MIRNCNSVSVDVVGDIIENDYELRLFLLFFPSQFGNYFGHFDIA